MRIDDGHPTIVEFALAASVKFWEKTVTPPGMQGGGPNDTTTMRNTAWRTRAPKKLLTLSEMTMTAAYDPEVYDDVLAMMQQNQLITITFPDESTLEFYGFLDDFTPNEISEGEQPDADVTIVPTNQDNTGAEIAPSYTAPPAP